MRRPATFLVRATLGGTLGVFLAGTTALAQQQEEDLSLEQSLIQKFLGGLGASTAPDIEYRERSPLVIPPSTELPPPESRPPTAANPAWPKDADVVRRQETVAHAKAVTARSRDGDILDPARPLPKDALNGNPRLQTGPQPPNTLPPISEADAGRRLSAKELGYKGGLFGSLFGSKGSDETTTFTGEGPRTKLTQPPTGYQTPAATAPYGATTKQKNDAKAIKPEDIPVGKTY